MELEAERISPTLTSRYMTNYITSPTTDIYHQNYHSPRQNMHSSYYPMMENDRNYLKRHYYMKEEGDNEDRERKFEKIIDHGGHYSHPYHTNEQIYDTYNNNTLYPENVQDDRTTTNSDSTNLTLINSASNSNTDNYPNNSSPATSTEDASDRIADSPKSVVSVKKTKGRVKIKMEYISNKLRRYTTFSKRKTGIMKKAYELSTLTGTQVMLLVASETGHVYTFATRKLQPMITSDAGKQLIQTCLNTPETPEIPVTNSNPSAMGSEQRMSASGFEETELSFDVQDLNDEKQKVRQPLAYNPSSGHLPTISQSLPSSHSHLYTLPHPSQHYSSSPQTHYSSPHYSPPSPSVASQHFQPPSTSQYPSYYENNGTATVPLSSYQSIRTPTGIPISPPANSSATEAIR